MKVAKIVSILVGIVLLQTLLGYALFIQLELAGLIELVTVAYVILMITAGVLHFSKER